MKRIFCLILIITLMPISSLFAIEFPQEIFKTNDNFKFFLKNSLSDLTKSSNEQGKDTVLVLDNSSSMAGKPLESLKKSAIKFCTEYLAENENNQIAIVAYDEDSEAYKDFTNDTEKLTMAINSLSGDGIGSDMNSALIRADMLLDTSKNSDKNIILMSDGVPTSGEHKSTGNYTLNDCNITYNAKVPYFEYANSVYDTAKNLSVKYNIYTIGFFHSTYSNTRLFAKRLMNDISNIEFFEVSNPDKLDEAFGNITGDILKKTGEFYYSSNFKSSMGRGTYFYDDSYFTSDASIYNSQKNLIKI